MLEGAEFSWEAGVLRLHPSSCMCCSPQEHTVLGRSTVCKEVWAGFICKTRSPCWDTHAPGPSALAVSLKPPARLQAELCQVRAEPHATPPAPPAPHAHPPSTHTYHGTAAMSFGARGLANFPRFWFLYRKKNTN